MLFYRCHNKRELPTAGFTLVEIIAMLLILGILAAVAIPKYMSIQAEARSKVAYNLVAGAQSALSIAFFKAIIESGNSEEAWNLLDGDVCVDNISTSGYDDYTLICAKSGDAFDITVEYEGSVISSSSFNKPK